MLQKIFFLRSFRSFALENKRMDSLKKKQAYAHRVKEVLERLVPHPVIPLSFSDPYTLLVAALLSAQCTDERVNRVTKKLFQRASTPSEMVVLSIDEIEAIIRPCGLSKTKAKNIWNLSQILLQKYQEKVPASLEALESLPGVGRKTASIVLVQAFSIPAFPVDRHIFRSAHRWKLSRGTSTRKVEEDLKKLFAKEEWGTVHLLIILAARTFCPARPHRSSECPICSELPR